MNKYEYRGDFEKCFRLIHYKGEFQITPEEATKIFNDSFVVGCDPGYHWQNPRFQYIKDALQALLLTKGVIDSPVDLNIVPDPAEVIMSARINKDSPDYLKQSILPATEKVIILDYVQDNTF